MQDGILPTVLNDLYKSSSRLRIVKILRSDDNFDKVTLVDDDHITRRHTIDLTNHKCSCRQWQITGKPCNHALGWICSIRGAKIEDYVHPYYSVQRFKAAYAGRIPTMLDRSQWPMVDLGFNVYPPKQKRASGRPRVQRIRGALEPGRRRVKCRRCRGFGHFTKTCKLAEAPSEAEDGNEGGKGETSAGGDAATTRKR